MFFFCLLLWIYCLCLSYFFSWIFILFLSFLYSVSVYFTFLAILYATRDNKLFNSFYLLFSFIFNSDSLFTFKMSDYCFTFLFLSEILTSLIIQSWFIYFVVWFHWLPHSVAHVGSTLYASKYKIVLVNIKMKNYYCQTVVGYFQNEKTVHWGWM